MNDKHTPCLYPFVPITPGMARSYALVIDLVLPQLKDKFLRGQLRSLRDELNAPPTTIPPAMRLLSDESLEELAWGTAQRVYGEFRDASPQPQILLTPRELVRFADLFRAAADRGAE